MSIFSKLVTAVKGGVTEVGEAIADHQAIRILDQEIRDADTELAASRDQLASMVAKRKMSDDKIAELNKQIEQYESYAIKALEKGDETLATEVAERISALESERDSEQQLSDTYKSSEAGLREAVSKAEGNLKRLKQQVDVVKATEAVQKAQMTVATRTGGADTAVGNAMSSLDRLKQRQAERAAKMSAAEEIAGSADGGLDAKLKAAGLMEGGSGSANSVLERLKAKQKG